MIQNVEIRELEKRDIPQVVRINEMITRKPNSAVLEELLIESLGSNKWVSFVALTEGSVVGFMTGQVKRGSFGLEKSFWIEMLGVDPKVMGEGIGRALAEHLFAFCQSRNVGDVYTAVRWDAVDLLSFFKTLGFDRSNFINLRRQLQ